MRFEYLDLQPPSRDVLLAADIAQMLVEEQAHPDDNGTLMKAFISLCFLDLTRRQPPIRLGGPNIDFQTDMVRQRYKRIPCQLAFMVSTLLHSDDPRLLADYRAVSNAHAQQRALEAAAEACGVEA